MKVFKVKFRLLIIFIALITSVLLVHTILDRYGKFDADIWGTVSDWIMVIVTFVTAIFLYATLKSQNSVQQMQQKLFEIEMYNHRQSIKPYLTFTAYIDNIIKNGLTQSYTINLRFAFNKGEARNVQIKETAVYFFKGISLTGLPINSVQSTLNDSFSVKILMKDHPISNDFIYEFDKTISIRFVAMFEDITGCKYEQVLFYYKNRDGNGECQSEIPIEVISS